MKFCPSNAWSRYLLAIVAGLLLASAFPKIGFAGGAWIAPALMIAAAMGRSRGERFRIGYVAGLTHYLASLYWLLLIPVAWLPILGWVALSAFLSLFLAGWVWLVAPAGRAPDGKGERDGCCGLSLAALDELASRSWSQRTWWALSGAAGWVAMEMIIARIFSGFPWNLLGASQYQILPLIQIASITGIYGVSFIVVWVSLSLLVATLAIVRRPAMRSAWMPEMMLPLIVVVVMFAFGFRQLWDGPPPARSLRVTLVQPSIPQTLIWNPDADTERFRELIGLSELALAQPTDVLIWPEAAVPKLLRYDEPTFQAVTELARAHRVWMIIGADDAERRRDATEPSDVEYFNSSFLIDPDGRLVDQYRKRSLVIFGEYIPLARSLPFMKLFTPIQGGFTPGDRPVSFELPELDVTTSVLICFEDVFPHHARRYVKRDTDFLVNLTNNGWFGESAAQWQHAVSAVFRAVENGLPLIRCSNNGLTCWVDANGRLRQVFAGGKGTVYEPGFMVADIPLPEPENRRAATFYNRHGDVFGWACAGIAAAMLGLRLVRLRGNRGNH